MNKIAIITKYSSYNFGAMLQSYALQKVIQNLGAECVIIDNERKTKNYLLSWKSPYGILNNIYYLVFRNQLKSSINKFDNFVETKYDKTRRYFDFEDLCNYPPDADVFITGSDQVWNPLKIEDAYFLRFVPKNSIRASYAASLGISYIPKGCQHLMSEYLNDMDFISVREKTAKHLLENNLSLFTQNSRLTTHIDPVFLLDQNEWKKLAKNTAKLNKEYILCYILYRPKWLNNWLKKIHKETGLPIIAISTEPYRNIYHNKMIRNAGPQEFIGLIDNAKFVISSSFHGVALSIAMKKPFYAILNPKAPSRIEDMLELFGLKDRIVDPSNNVIYNLNYINYQKIDDTLRCERDRSIKYLKFLIYDVNKKPEVYRHNILSSFSNISSVGKNCTACKVCKEVCEFNAISFKSDINGFEYPVVDLSLCKNCGLCAKKCHVLNHKKYNSKESSIAYYGWNKNERVRMSSSSGGFFSAISDFVLSKNGIVLGAYFDKNNKKVRHTSSDVTPMEKIIRSKYVESDLNNTHSIIKQALKEDRYVLFCGTPCQCSGIRNLFGYGNKKLILCDFFCHGVPSPFIFKDYLKSKEKENNDLISDIWFRTKYFGWSQYGIDIIYDNKKTEHTVGRCEWYFLSTMIDNMFLRDSCYSCDKAVYHDSDITIGDYWGIKYQNPEANDNKGISVIISNNELGASVINEIKHNIELYELKKHFLDYAFRVKTSDDLLKKSNDRTEKYFKYGKDKYIKKIYRKKLLLNKIKFNLRKSKYKLK